MKRVAAITLLFLAGFFFLHPESARAGAMCETPDGFFLHQGGLGGTGLSSGQGLGGTGISDERGLGGTGVTAEIGVYGRITGWGSICVNGMHVHYDQSMPVKDGDRTVSAKALRIGQVVALNVGQDRGRFVARRMAIENILAGPVSGVDAAHDKVRVENEVVLVGKQGRPLLKSLKRGDFVTVSGLRRADGVIVAGYIERSRAGTRFLRKGHAGLGGARAFSIQGYVRKTDGKGHLRLADGTEIRLPKSLAKRAAYNDRVIAFGARDEKGAYVARGITIERADFTTGAVIPVGKAGNRPEAGPPPRTEDAPLSLPAAPPAQDGALPGGIEIPRIQLPDTSGGAIELPPVSIPDGPQITPPVDIPVPAIPLPTVDIPAPAPLPDLNLPTGR